MAHLLALLFTLSIVFASFATSHYDRVSLYDHTHHHLHSHPHLGHIHIGKFCALVGNDALDDALWIGYDGPVFAEVVPHHHDPSTVVQMNPPWNLDRIDQPSLPLDGKYRYPISAGDGTTVYVLDSGVDENSLDAVFGANFISNATLDDYGHGTHVACVIGHEIYGVAKSADIVAVKILNERGTGKWSNVLRALEWIVKNHHTDPRLGIVNLSLSGKPFPPIIVAIHAMTKLGFHVVVSAGNGAKEACETSPANTPDAFRVGASDINDEMASMSNYGDCVDIYAPGIDIVSCFPKSLKPGSSTKSLSGTSMAAPHVSGVIALLQSVLINQSKEPYSPAEMKRLVTGGRIRRHILCKQIWKTRDVMRN